MSRRVRKIAIRMSAFFLGVVFLAVIVEGSLRIASGLRKSEHKPSFDPNVIRIVTMGESTTARTGSAEFGEDWPRVLQSLLNEELKARGDVFRVQIFNIARGASSSPFQLAALLETSTVLKPDIIVSMLGINDSTVEQVEADFLYRNSLLIRLIYWSKIAWTCPRCYDVKMSAPLPTRETLPLESEAENAGLNLLREREIDTVVALEDFSEKLRELQDRYAENASAMNLSVGFRLFQISDSVKIRDVNKQLHERLLVTAEKLYVDSYDQLVGRLQWQVEGYCLILSRLEKLPHCLQTMKLAIANGAHVTPQLLTIAGWAAAEDDPEMRKIFRAAGFRIDSKKNSSGRVVRSVYRRIGKFVNETEAIWFPMQYPTGSVEGLKFLLSDAPENDKSFHSVFYSKDSYQPLKDLYRNVFFVSNENFITIVNSQNEAEYFRDYFARVSGLNFGHTTAKGHELIARNLLSEMLKHWPVITEIVVRRRKNGY